MVCYFFLKKTEKTMKYDKIIYYRFEAYGEYWLAEKTSDSVIEICEARKNGQEDTHMCGTLELINGKWEWESEDNTVFDYAGEDAANEILNYINSNPLPK